MKLKLLADIGQSLLLARWRQSLVAAFGVTFSISMFIALLGFMNGLNDLLDGLILNRTPHVRLFNDIRPNQNQPINTRFGAKSGHNFIRSVKASGGRLAIYDADAIIKTIRKDPRVVGLSPKINAPVLYNSGTVDITGIVSGIDVEAEMRLFFFKDNIRKGDPLDLQNIPNSLILGTGLAQKLLAEVGDVVQVTTARGEIMPLKMVGIFQSGILALDNVQSFASIETAQKLLAAPSNYVTDIQIKLHKIETAPAVAREFAQLFGADAEDFQTANVQFETGSSVRTTISYSVGLVLLIVAGFGIYNILNMMIYDKMDTIAILKATGFSGRDVRRIFIGIALTIGVVGGVLGLVFGLLLSLLIDQIPFVTPSFPNVTTYGVAYDVRFYVIGIVFALITTYLAGFFPAKKASRIDPVVIIRGK